MAGTDDLHACLQVIESVKSDRTLGKNLQAPSVSYGAINLYMRGVLEEETRPNLRKVSLASRGLCDCCRAATWLLCLQYAQIPQLFPPCLAARHHNVCLTPQNAAREEEIWQYRG